MTGAALYAGPGALRLLASGARGEVVVAGRRGAYAQLGGGHLHVCAPGGPFGPLSVAVPRAERLGLRPGLEVEARAGELRIGGQAVSLERARVRGRAAAPARVRVDAETAEAVAARLPPLAPFLLGGVRALEQGDLPAAVRALAGRGPGLTPDGDDVLAGYAAWRHATSHPVRLADAAAGLASPIGLSYLRCAERGELPGAAADLLAALLSGDRAAALATLGALGRWGSSSGAALAHGMLAGYWPARTAASA